MIELFIIVLLVVVVYFIQPYLPKSSCMNNCNQGRTCNCRKNNMEM